MKKVLLSLVLLMSAPAFADNFVDVPCTVILGWEPAGQYEQVLASVPLGEFDLYLTECELDHTKSVRVRGRTGGF